MANLFQVWDVSIHAPVKSATIATHDYFVLFDVSIHAPVKSATLIALIVIKTQLSFNPRAREEREVPQSY